MAHGRELLRKAGEALRNMDEGYSQKVVDMYFGPEDRPRNYDGKPLLGSAAAVGAIYGGGTPASALRSGDANSMVAAATGIGAKYVAPIAGAGLALKGAMDMAAVLNQQTSTTLEP